MINYFFSNIRFLLEVHTFMLPSDQYTLRVKFDLETKYCYNYRLKEIVSIAKNCGVTRQAIYKYYNAQAYPSVYVYSRICKEFNLTMDELFYIDLKNDNYYYKKA